MVINFEDPLLLISIFILTDPRKISSTKNAFPISGISIRLFFELKAVIAYILLSRPA